MRSRREQFGDIIDTLKHLGAHPNATELDPLHDRVAQLDHRLLAITDRDEHDTLSKLSSEANSLLEAAYQRGGIARDVAHAARARQIHDALHPTILSPHQAPEVDHEHEYPDLLEDFFER